MPVYKNQQNMLTFLSIPCIPFSFSFQIQHSWTVWNTKKIYQKFKKKKCHLLEFTFRYITQKTSIYICTAKVCCWYTAKYIWFTSKLNDFPCQFSLWDPTFVTKGHCTSTLKAIIYLWELFSIGLFIWNQLLWAQSQQN